MQAPSLERYSRCLRSSASSDFLCFFQHTLQTNNSPMLCGGGLSSTAPQASHVNNSRSSSVILHLPFCDRSSDTHGPETRQSPVCEDRRPCLPRRRWPKSQTSCSRPNPSSRGIQ